MRRRTIDMGLRNETKGDAIQPISEGTGCRTHFAVVPLRFTFQAEELISLPHGQETNVFRGTLGAALRRISPQDYSRLFEARWPEGPSGYRDAPRPFVLRWPERLSTYARGTLFSLDVFLFDVDAPPVAALFHALEAAAAAGIGKSRGRASLIGVAPRPEEAKPVQLPLEAPQGAGKIRICFLTPTELKSEGQVCSEPVFDMVFRRLAERVWSLGRLYQGWVDWDYRALLDTAPLVQLTAWDWRRKELSRHSSRTNQTHSLGGFTGWAEYEGPVGTFINLLQIGCWTGVGRQTVWGKGEIRVDRR